MSHITSLPVIYNDSLFLYLPAQPFPNSIRIEHIHRFPGRPGIVGKRFLHVIALNAQVQIAVAIASKLHTASEYDCRFYISVLLKVLLERLHQFLLQRMHILRMEKTDLLVFLSNIKCKSKLLYFFIAVAASSPSPLT